MSLNFKKNNSSNLQYDYNTIVKNETKILALTSDLKLDDKKAIRKSIRTFFENVESFQKSNKLDDKQLKELKSLTNLLGFSQSDISNKYIIKF